MSVSETSSVTNEIYQWIVIALLPLNALLNPIIYSAVELWNIINKKKLNKYVNFFMNY